MENRQKQRHRKSLQSFILVGVMVMFMIFIGSIVYGLVYGGAIVNNNIGNLDLVTGQDLTSANVRGVQVRAIVNTTLLNVRTYPTTSASNCSIYLDDQTTLIGYANMANQLCTFPSGSVNFTAGQYYRIIVTNSSATGGSTWRNNYAGTPGGYFNKTNAHLNISAGITAGLNWVEIDSITNITTQAVSSNNITVTLSSPSNNLYITNLPVMFNSTITSSIINLTNATLYIWNSTGIFNRTTNILTGQTSNDSIWNITNLNIGNYTWNVYGCGVDSVDASKNYCSWDYSNQTFIYGINLKNIIYNNDTFELSNENFNLNLNTSTNIISITGILNYNNINYTSTSVCVNNQCNLSNTINIPLITGNYKNNTFYWIVTIFDGTSQFTLNSASNNQSVTAVTLTKCNSGVIALNFTSKDEQLLTPLNPFIFDGLFEYSTAQFGTKKTLNIFNTTSNSISLCISYNTTYYINGIIAYNNDTDGSYSTRNYFFQNHIINNVTQNITLYLLKPSSSTSFVLQVQDRSLLPVPNVLIEAQRCYPGNNFSKTVFISRTDSNGLTTGNFEAETALYKFKITNNSNTLLEISECSKIVPQTAPYTLTFQLGTGYTSPFINMNNLSDITKILIFNYTTNNVTFTYIDTSNIFQYATLVVKSLNYSGNTNPIICSKNNSLTTGIITCNIPNAGSYSASAYVYRTDETLIDQIVFTVETFSSTEGYYGVFLGFFIILICAFAFKFNEIAGIWLVNAAVILCNFIGLISFGYVFITSMLCLSVIITAVLER